jgi:hypothetical protein
MPQGDNEAIAMEETLVRAEDEVVTNLNAAEVLQPCIGSFNLPASPIAA